MKPPTFLVTLEIEENQSLAELAKEIFDLLSTHFAVSKVKPWLRPTDPESANPVTSNGAQVLAAFQAARGGKR